MNHTYNQFVVKNGNKSLVLKTINEHSPISRADIAQKVGLNKGTVSSLVSELLDEDLIYESGPGESSGGRRPVMLLFKQTAGYSIGIDLGVNYLLGVLTDLKGTIIQEQKLTFSTIKYEEIENHLFTVIENLLSFVPECTYGVIGIGVGVPGMVNNDGQIILAPNLKWKDISLKQVLEDRFNLPVVVENEANAGAYGEKRFGVSKEYNSIVYISAGIGIGTGLVLNGELYRGTEGFSGELGHMTIEINGPKCSCGNIGCWELYASEQSLLKKANALGIGNNLKLDDLIKLAEADNKQVLSLFHEIGDYLGIGLTSIINTFNPEQVVIGNKLAAAEKWLKDSMIDRIKTHTIGFQQKNLSIDFSRLETYAAALGVSAFTVENFLKIDLETR